MHTAPLPFSHSHSKKYCDPQPVSHILLHFLKLANAHQYLDIVVNKNDVAVLDGVDGVVGNRHLAGEHFLRLPFDGFPNNFTQAQVADVGGGMGAVQDFLL